MSEDTTLVREYVAWAIRSVGRMPLIYEATDDGFIRMAAWESFGVNVRLLAEFLVRPNNGKDYRGSLYASWLGNQNPQALPHWEAATALKAKWWPLVSQEVMHLSLARDPEHAGGLSNAPEDWIRVAANDTLLVAEDFVQHLTNSRHTDAEFYAKPLGESKEDLKRLMP